MSFDEGSRALSPSSAPPATVQLKAQEPGSAHGPHLQKPSQDYWRGEDIYQGLDTDGPTPVDHGEFSAPYYDQKGELRPHRVDKTLSYEQYKDGLGPMRASSESLPKGQQNKYTRARSTQVLAPLTMEEFLTIFMRDKRPKDPEKAAKWEETNAKLAVELPRINEAFRIMKLDTAGAQAHYLANAYMESSELQFMTETQKLAGDEAFKQTGDATLDEKWLDDATDGKIGDGKGEGVTKVTGYEPGGSINRADGDWDKSFIGRGPLQVTHVDGYLQALGVLEARLDELESKAPTDPERADIPLIAEAVRAIKANPKAAADRRYTYLFSAAFMKRPVRQDDQGRLDLKGGTHEGLNIRSASPGTAGMGNHDQAPDSRDTKNKIYEIAVGILSDPSRNTATAAP